MPKARPPQDPVSPAPLSEDEAAFILATVRQFYGDDAVVRNYGPDPRRLLLHVETDKPESLEKHTCLGVLMCEIASDYITLVATTRGRRIWGDAKIAYRQGVIIETN